MNLNIIKLNMVENTTKIKIETDHFVSFTLSASLCHYFPSFIYTYFCHVLKCMYLQDAAVWSPRSLDDADHASGGHALAGRRRLGLAAHERLVLFFGVDKVADVLVLLLLEHQTGRHRPLALGQQLDRHHVVVHRSVEVVKALDEHLGHLFAVVDEHVRLQVVVSTRLENSELIYNLYNIFI